MSTWAALAVKGTAVAATTAAGSDGARVIALDGFAAGALLTAMCFLVVVARKTARARVSGPRDPWQAHERRSRERPDYYAMPADTHSPAVATDESLAAPAPVPFATMAGAIVPPADEAAEWEVPAPPPPSFAPDEPDPVGYVPGPAEEFGPDLGFDADTDDDIVLPGEDDDWESGRGHRAHRVSGGQGDADRRSDAKRTPPRHAAPSSRFGGRKSSKVAAVPLVPDRN